MRQLIISILLLLPLTSMASAQADSEQLYWARIKAKNSKERTAIANTGVSIEVVNKDDVVVLAHKDELAKLKKTGNVAVSFEFSALDFPQKDANFHNYAELQEALKELSRNHADIVTLSTIGKTLEGRDIPLITIGKNQKDPSIAAVFFVGGHHAREHISIETPLLVAKNLAAGWKAGDLRITQLLNNRTVYIVPMLNVDGAEFDIDTGSYKSWRKNRRSNGDGTFGVDLNRNYDHQWSTVGASGNTR
ncbi:MAG: M14 family zinc carboxypeptidase, partial [Bdellovibrionota bacterium]